MARSLRRNYWDICPVARLLGARRELELRRMSCDMRLALAHEETETLLVAGSAVPKDEGGDAVAGRQRVQKTAASGEILKRAYRPCFTS